MKLSYLTNSDANVQEKMRFFASYFSFANEFLGKHPRVPYENPLSLLEKSIFQVENNFDHSSLYVSSYLSQLFSFHAPFESSLRDFNKLSLLYDQFKLADKKKEWIKNTPVFLSTMIELRNHYEEKLFDDTYTALLHYMKCVHRLKTHKKEIEYRTTILVSLFRLKGHSKKLLDDYVKRILSTSRFDFPLPLEFVQIHEKAQYIEKSAKFFQSRSFDQQFEGFRNIYITEHHKFGNFFFVIDDCFLADNIKKKFRIRFDQVTFISPQHKDLALLRRSIKEDDKENPIKNSTVFFGKNKLLAYVHTGYEKRDAKKEYCLQIVEEELTYLNQYLDTHLQVNPLHLLLYESFGTERWSSRTSLRKKIRVNMNEYTMEDAAENSFEVLRNVASPAKSIILQNEKVFLKAYSRSDVEYFWIYLENMFAPIHTNSDKIRKVAGSLLTALLDDLKKDFLVQLGSMLIPFAFNHAEENFTDDEVMAIHAEIFVNRKFDFDFKKYQKAVRSPFLKDLITYHTEFTSPRFKHVWNDHFSNLLIDLYGYRNSLLHTGKTDRYSRGKLQNILPRLLSRARWKLIRACEQYPTSSYHDLIAKILE